MYARRVWAAFMAALSIVVTACGGGSSGTTPVGPPVIKPDSFLVSLIPDCGDSTLEFPGGSRLCSAEATWSTGSRVSVTFSSSWSATGSAVSVEPGKVTPMAPGEATVTVAYGGKTASVKLVVRLSTIWFDTLSAPAKDRLRVMTSGYGKKTRRFDDADLPLATWASPEILARVGSSGVDSVLALHAEGKLQFRVVTDSASAKMHLVYDSKMDPRAQCGGVTKFFSNTDQYLRVVVRVSPDSRCDPAGSGSPSWHLRSLGHEVGHAIAYDYEGLPNTDIMSQGGGMKWGLSVLNREVKSALYQVPPGTPVPQI